MANEKVALCKEELDVLYYEMVLLLEKKLLPVGYSAEKYVKAPITITPGAADDTSTTATGGKVAVYFTDSSLEYPTSEELLTLLESGHSAVVILYWADKGMEVRDLRSGETQRIKQGETLSSDCLGWEINTADVFSYLGNALEEYDYLLDGVR